MGIEKVQCIVYKNLSTGAIGVKADLVGAIGYARRYGFAGIDFSIEEASRLAEAHDAQYVKELFDAAGITPGSWNPPVNWGGDEVSYLEQLQALPKFAQLAHTLGAVRCATWVPPASDERPFAENFAFHVARFRPIAEILRDNGCRLGLEFIGPATLRATRKYSFVYDLPGMLDLCNALGTGNAGLLLDCWHWYTSGGNAADLEGLKNQNVVVVHVNDAPAGIAVDEQLDNQRCLPGETGVIDIATFMSTLRRIDYDGPITVEPFSARVRALAPEEAVAATAASLKAIMG